MMNRNNRGPTTPPVSEGEELDVRIEALGGKGDGIAKVRGFVLFIPNVKEGETCRVRITKVLKSVGFAEKIGEAQGAVGKSSREVQPEPEPEPVADSDDFGDEETEEEAEQESEEEESEESDE